MTTSLSTGNDLLKSTMNKVPYTSRSLTIAETFLTIFLRMLQIRLWISFKDFVTTLETIVFQHQQKNNFGKASTFDATKPYDFFALQ